MNKQLRILAILLSLCTVCTILTCIGASAETAEDYCLANLLFSEDETRGVFTANGAEIVDEDLISGAVTIKLTAPSATVSMAFAENFFKEGDGGTIYGDAPINVRDTEKHPYFAYDYASADGVVVNPMIAHYTRKDKASSSTLATLYLNSMEEASYAKFQKFVGTGYGVWDWGVYLTNEKGDSCVFEDGIHRFCKVDATLTGKVGAQIVFYKFGVYTTADNSILHLGEERPEPTPEESESSAEASSEDTPSAEPESSDAQSSEAESSAESSVAESSAAESSAAESSAAESSAAGESKDDASSVSEGENSVAASNDTSSQISAVSSDSGSDDGNTLLWIIIASIAVVAVIVVIVVILRKKK